MFRQLRASRTCCVEYCIALSVKVRNCLYSQSAVTKVALNGKLQNDQSLIGRSKLSLFCRVHEALRGSYDPFLGGW